MQISSSRQGQTAALHKGCELSALCPLVLYFCFNWYSYPLLRRDLVSGLYKARHSLSAQSNLISLAVQVAVDKAAVLTISKLKVLLVVQTLRENEVVKHQVSYLKKATFFWSQRQFAGDTHPATDRWALPFVHLTLSRQ